MQRAQLLALASAIQAIRNDWTRDGIISQLTKLDDTWKGTEGALALHAMTITANPAAQTPGALNALPATKTTAETTPGTKEPNCFICGQPKTHCQRQQDWEIEHGIPDPHVFETAEEAEANASQNQIVTRAGRTPTELRAFVDDAKQQIRPTKFLDQILTKQSVNAQLARDEHSSTQPWLPADLEEERLAREANYANDET